MFLLIFESLSFTELAVVGVVALVILGPRRLPELARKAGKIMAEFRKVTNDFKETWEKEAAIDDETQQILKNPFEYEDKLETEKASQSALPSGEKSLQVPEIKEVSNADFKALKEKAETQIVETQTESLETGKQNWL